VHYNKIDASRHSGAGCDTACLVREEREAAT
jgi:hypothetical protein